MCNGESVALKIFGPHSFNEDGSLMSYNEQMAIVSHYLHNKGHKLQNEIMVRNNFKKGSEQLMIFPHIVLIFDTAME